jgi:hypothetical protein
MFACLRIKAWLSLNARDLINKWNKNGLSRFLLFKILRVLIVVIPT